MSKNIIPQSQTNKNQIIGYWITASEKAIEALFVFKADLRAWAEHPHVTDEAFMAALGRMFEADLYTWIDAQGNALDILRSEIVTESNDEN